MQTNVDASAPHRLPQPKGKGNPLLKKKQPGKVHRPRSTRPRTWSTTLQQEHTALFANKFAKQGAPRSQELTAPTWSTTLQPEQPALFSRSTALRPEHTALPNAETLGSPNCLLHQNHEYQFTTQQHTPRESKAEKFLGFLRDWYAKLPTVEGAIAAVGRRLAQTHPGQDSQLRGSRK